MQADRATPLQLAPVGDKAVDLDFEGGRLSSEAGLVLLKAPDEPLGLTRALAAVLSDPREARRVHLTPHDLRKQRVVQRAAGDEDANDAHPWRPDPIVNRRRERWPDTGAPLASQPTISRCAHCVSRTALYRLARVLVEPCRASYRPPPKVSVLEVADTEDRAPGQQEQARDDADDGGYGVRLFAKFEVSTCC